MNTLGTNLKITSIGESHGELVGVVIDGCPAGLRLDLLRLQHELDRRRPGQSKITTQRQEQDKVEVLTGQYHGVTTGAPLTMVVRNRDRDSSKYLENRWTPRPGHADYTAGLRYGERQDPRGGGRFSGRITAGFMIAGCVAKQLLETLGTRVTAYTYQIGSVRTRGDVDLDKVESNEVRCPDPVAAKEMIKEIERVLAINDSIGGRIKCIAHNPPRGIGAPVFDALEGDLAKAFFAIPAVKAVEFGAGVAVADMLGSENNDEYRIVDGEVVTLTNHSGGILGGISTGMPITSTVSIKPTPSIARSQRTVNLREMKETDIKVEGRHDPCIVPRAVPVVEAMMAFVLADHALRAGVIPRVMGEGQ